MNNLWRSQFLSHIEARYWGVEVLRTVSYFCVILHQATLNKVTWGKIMSRVAGFEVQMPRQCDQTWAIFEQSKDSCWQGEGIYPLFYLWQQKLVPPPTSLPRPLTTTVCRRRYHFPSLKSIFWVIYITTFIHVADGTEGLLLCTLQFTWNVEREAWWTCVGFSRRSGLVHYMFDAPNSAHMEQSLSGVNMACFDSIILCFSTHNQLFFWWIQLHFRNAFDILVYDMQVWCACVLYDMTSGGWLGGPCSLGLNDEKENVHAHEPESSDLQSCDGILQDASAPFVQLHRQQTKSLFTVEIVLGLV